MRFDDLEIVDLNGDIYHQGHHGVSVADETVYPVQAMPVVSADVPGWTDTMMAYFRELGFRITDLE